MDYNQPFELQRQTASQSMRGDPIVKWATAYRSYGYVKSLSSTEFWQAAAAQAQDTIKLFCRWHPALNVDTRIARILWNGSAWNITSIENVNGRGESAVVRMVRDE